MPAVAQTRNAPSDAALDGRIRDALSRHWGFTDLYPLQLEAVNAALAGRDALVVLPTGGGKSLCYQLPPLLRPAGQPSLCVVVSPLIALMKDQVDGLRLAGYPAGALHSGVKYNDAADVRYGVESGQIKLLLVAPERLLGEGFLAWLVNLARKNPARAVASIAIDEAHCISQWGHDFRPEYRRLRELREALPGTPMQAFTATATPRVREDIVHQLGMHDPAVLVGVFDRPNLAYRVVQRTGNGEDQAEEILRRHQSDAAIVYCISRKQTEQMAGFLTERGLKAAAYHAGMDSADRHRVQEDFSNVRLNIVVATVAFGMGIDRGDVRCVLHASMPKTVEAYQQETGRAGRDGLPAECVMLYSSVDAAKWSSLIERSAAESEVEVSPEYIAAQKDLISRMQRVAAGTRCRHRMLSEYFGQEYAAPGDAAAGCGACDVCLGELETEADSATIAKKIVSCIARLRGERNDSFGAVYIADVLRGAGIARIVERKHHLLSTFGLLRDMEKDRIINHIDQLVDAGVLSRDDGQYPVIRLAAASAAVLRGEREVKLLRARAGDSESQQTRARRADSGTSGQPLSSEERVLFETLSALRRSVADGLGVPPFLVFGDAALEEMCRLRPASLAMFANVRGVGRAKLDQFGERFVAAIVDHCRAKGLATDVRTSAPKPLTDSRRVAADLFGRGMPIEDVMTKLARAKSTILQYLVEYIVRERPANIAPWVAEAEYRRICDTAQRLNEDRAKPIFESLNGSSSYESIRLVLAHMRSSGVTMPCTAAR